jgi:hypothetical protein
LVEEAVVENRLVVVALVAVAFTDTTRLVVEAIPVESTLKRVSVLLFRRIKSPENEPTVDTPGLPRSIKSPIPLNVDDAW